MKKEINANDIIYMIAIFMMPIITFIGVTKLQTDIINISDVIKVGASDYNTLFMGDMIIFITCWVALFVSYLLYKANIKLAQGIIFIGATVFLGYNIYLAINTYGSISSIINPLIVLTTSLYALCKPSNKTNISIPVVREKNDLNNQEKDVKNSENTSIEEEKEDTKKEVKKSAPKKSTSTKKNTKKAKSESDK